MIITNTDESDEDIIKREKRQAWKNKKPKESTPAPAKGSDSKQKPNISDNVPADELELTEREEKELQENLTTWLAVMANKDKKLANRLGHQFEDMILRCTIKSTNCTHPRQVIYN